MAFVEVTARNGAKFDVNSIMLLAPGEEKDALAAFEQTHRLCSRVCAQNNTSAKRRLTEWVEPEESPMKLAKCRKLDRFPTTPQASGSNSEKTDG